MTYEIVETVVRMDAHRMYEEDMANERVDVAEMVQAGKRVG